MLEQSTGTQNRPATITPEIRPRMPWRVVEVAALDGFRISVHFVDGTEGKVDLSGLMRPARAGVFARLADASLFAQIFIDRGAVAWPGELDLAPDAMCAEIKKAGEWVLS